MGHAAFTPAQRNWQWFKDDGAEPTESLADENNKPTLPDNTSKIRLRANFAETAGGSKNNILVGLQYSLNEADWSGLDAANHWNWADGQATEGNTVTGRKLGDTDTEAEYVESENGAGTFDYVGNENAEWDYCVVPTGNVQANTTYYFRLTYDGGTEVPLDGGETHPQVLTAAAAAGQPYMARVQWVQGMRTYGGM